MKTIQKNIQNEIIIKNSRFITQILKINDSNITTYLEQSKKQFPKATHYCYAYIYKQEKKSSDDGEPGETAGLPMLNVLQKENLNNILVITIRYFGGIKLGAGGLIRAYTKSVTEALKQAKFLELIMGYKVEISCNYSQEKQLLYHIEKEKIINKKYDESITYQVLITKDNLDKIANYSYQILEELYIEKEKN